jgi:altronate dehydratase large subunit
MLVPLCACSADVARMLAEKTPGTVYIDNQNGCGQAAKDLELTIDVLAGLAANPNVYAVLAVSLGCEELQFPLSRDRVRALTNKPLECVCIQQEGGIGRSLKKGIEIARRLVAEAAQCQRVECPLSNLILGTNCGGSDPTSGLASNRVVGDIADRLAGLGATTIISETPEFIGAENVLAKQAASPEVGKEIIRIVKDFEDRLALVGENPRSGNPSPGNKASGITTLEEKSLGCIHKAGTQPIQAVFHLGDMIDKSEKHGTVVMDTVAYDVASVTEMTAAGSQMTLFTTGLGNPIGNPVAPVLKITGNHKTFEWDNDFIDFDASAALDSTKSVHELGAELLELIVQVCNGKLVKAEEWGITSIAINHLCTYT